MNVNQSEVQTDHHPAVSPELVPSAGWGPLGLIQGLTCERPLLAIVGISLCATALLWDRGYLLPTKWTD